MLNKIPAAHAATRPLAGFGAGACLCARTQVSSHTGFAGVGYQQTTRTQLEMTRVIPVNPGGVGPHPDWEPEPV